MRLVLPAVAVILLITSCTNEVPDRFQELTGAVTEIERLVACKKVYEWQAVNLIMSRDSLSESSELRPAFIEMINNTYQKYGEYFVFLETRDSAKTEMAERKLQKRFTQEEFRLLVKEYDELLVAHCRDFYQTYGVRSLR
ncbi:hypothetical protein [Neptuniibacter sp.]|uniref:hypothetical protein n=1 Tax=Neptuniibacter sp. TaxID=1962643 RepID=UPI00261DA0E4|nr:hypothetical protein [Neptuniibacter sp.]MCP4595763.1 hypothetical protein [Neptuniibacter sp.]